MAKKLFIVDDDSIIREGLCVNIAWEAHNIVLIGTAGNGLQALQAFQTDLPDIVIADIRMPFMDGLQLAQSIKETYPRIKVILLSSFGEFEYAQLALEQKVFEYLLKPIDGEELLNSVLRAAEEQDRESSIEKQLRTGLPLLRERFLEELVNQKLKPDDIVSGIEYLELPLQGERNLVAVVKADDYWTPDYKSRYGKEMLKFCIHNLIEEMIASYNKGFVFNSSEDELIIVFDARKEDVQDSLQKQHFGFLEQIQANVKTYLKTTVTIGVGYEALGWTGIAESCKEARTALEFRHIAGTDRVIFVQDIGGKKEHMPDLSGLFQQLAMKAKFGLEKESLHLLGEMEAELTRSCFVSLRQMQYAVMELAITLFNEVQREKDIELGPIGEVWGFCQELQSLQTASELFGRMSDAIRFVTAQLQAERNDHQAATVRKAKEYVQLHYAKAGLSLQEVADAVHVSPSYLSYMFKQEGSVLFSDYLLELRMKHAVELMKHSRLKNFEIAEKVGFASPQYFTVCFKKYFGMPPQEYRNVLDE
jgi:two-component system response regulator YesN